MILKLSNPYFNPLVTLLLTLLIILIIFCVMSKFLYKSQHIQFDYENEYKNEYENNSDYKIKQYILIINQILDDNKKKNQESFENITLDDAQINIDNLDLISRYIDNIESGDLQNIKTTIDEVKKIRLDAKDKILNMLTNIYMIRYIDSIKQGNAVSYQQYLAYNNPNTNKYYKQYQ
jgi:hypothetical protein